MLQPMLKAKKEENKVKAVYAFAYGIDAMIRAECPDAFLNNSLLETCIKPYELTKYLRSVDIYTPIDHFRFNENNDIDGDILIQQLQRGPDGIIHYVDVGIWYHKNQMVVMDTDKIIWDYFDIPRQESGVPESTCGKECAPGEIAIQGEEPCCWTCHRYNPS